MSSYHLGHGRPVASQGSCQVRPPAWPVFWCPASPREKSSLSGPELRTKVGTVTMSSLCRLYYQCWYTLHQPHRAVSCGEANSTCSLSWGSSPSRRRCRWAASGNCAACLGVGKRNEGKKGISPPGTDKPSRPLMQEHVTASMMSGTARRASCQELPHFPQETSTEGKPRSQ